MDRAALEDLFQPAGAITVRRMFGGHGVYAGPVMVAIEARGAVYMRVDPLTRGEFAAEGSEPFVYEAGKKKVEMPYWRLPEAAFEDPDVLKRWFTLARGAAMRVASSRRPASFRRPGDD
jgi:DNA transformation protein